MGSQNIVECLDDIIKVCRMLADIVVKASEEITCADPESFVRGGSTHKLFFVVVVFVVFFFVFFVFFLFFLFFFWGGGLSSKDHQKRAIIGLPAKRH